MPLIQTVAPAIEPVSLEEARQHLRIDSDFQGDDGLIGMIISAARRAAENITSRSLITQQWRLVLDAFPGPSLMGVPPGKSYSLPNHGIQLDRGTVQSIDSIQYQAMNGQWYTMSASDYAADLSGCPARITPAFGKIWPITLPQIGTVKVNYTAGYGDNAADVPEGIRHWILMMVGTCYENREMVAILSRGKVEQLPFVDGLLDPYRVVLA